MGANRDPAASGSHPSHLVPLTSGRLFGLLVLLAIGLLVVLGLFAGGSHRLTYAPSSPLVTPEERPTQAGLLPRVDATPVVAPPTATPVATEEVNDAVTIAPTSTPLPVEPDRKTGLTLVGSVLIGLLLVIGIVIWRR